MYALPARSIRILSRPWVQRLSHFRLHRNDEHREALIVETLRFAGLELENDLCSSSYWSEAPLARRVALLLYLVDRGAVDRVVNDGRVGFAPVANAEQWVAEQPTLAPYQEPTLDLIAALRSSQTRRARLID